MVRRYKNFGLIEFRICHVRIAKKKGGHNGKDTL